MAAPPPFRIVFPEVRGDVHLTLLRIAGERGLWGRHVPEAQVGEARGGTGEVARALADGTADLGVGLTEGLIAATAPGAGFKLVATVVESPLSWAVLVAAASPVQTVEALRGRTFGISRPGGGAHLTTLVLARQRGWQEGADFTISELGDLSALVEGLKAGTVDAVLWEELATRHLVDAGLLRAVGRVTPPWPGFMLAARADFTAARPAAVRATLRTLWEAGVLFRRKGSYSLDLVVRTYRLSLPEAERWFRSVRYSEDGRLSPRTLTAVVAALAAAGVVRNQLDVGAILARGFAPIV